MSKSKKEIIDILSMPSNEPLSVREECEKYGIEYHVPSFEVIMCEVSNKIGDTAVIPFFYLQTEYDKSEKLINAVKKYEKAFQYYQKNEDSLNPFKGFKAIFGLWHFEKKLERTERLEKIKRYSRSEMLKYIDDYDAEKMKEVDKVKLQDKNLMHI